MKPEYDVIIIGSGPAGCAAAMYCRQQGFDTLIITGKRLTEVIENTAVQPSESIHPGVASVLAQLGAAHCIDIASQGVYEGIAVNDEYNPLGKDEHGVWKGYHINRALFDATLLQAAVQHGVTVIENDTVTDFITIDNCVTGVITKAGASLRCRYVIDASGYKRLGGKKMRFKESFYSPPLVVWTGVSEGIEATSFLFEKKCTRFIPYVNGWTWLAPELPGRCTWTRLELKGKQQFLPPAELQTYTQCPITKTANRRWRAFRPVCREGILLCGDAAAIIDPAAGQGILNAIVSAMMAAKTIKACISNPDFEALYLAKYDDWFMSDYTEKVNRLKYFYGMHGIEIF